MLAPPGIDSDSSGEEDETDQKKNKEIPKNTSTTTAFFRSLLSTSLPVRPTPKETEAKDESKGRNSTDSKPALSRKRVRIHVQGEGHPDKIDLIATPRATSPTGDKDENEDIAESKGGQETMRNKTGIVVASENTLVANQVVGLLRDILAQAQTNRGQGASSQTASIVPINGNLGNEDDHVVQAPAQAHDNLLGLSDMDKKSRLSKLAMFTKLAQLHSPAPRPLAEHGLPYQPMSAPWGHQAQIPQTQAQAQARPHAQAQAQAQAQAHSQAPTAAPVETHGGYTYHAIPEPSHTGPPMHWQGPHSTSTPLQDRSQNWHAQPPRLEHGSAQEYYQEYMAQTLPPQPQSAPPWTMQHPAPMPPQPSPSYPSSPSHPQGMVQAAQFSQQHQCQPNPPPLAPLYPGFQSPCQQCGFHNPTANLYPPWYQAPYPPPPAPGQFHPGPWYPPYSSGPYSLYTPPTYTSSPQDPTRDTAQPARTLAQEPPSPSEPLVPMPRGKDLNKDHNEDPHRQVESPTDVRKKGKNKSLAGPNVDTSAKTTYALEREALLKSPTIVVQSPEGFKEVDPYPQASKNPSPKVSAQSKEAAVGSSAPSKPVPSDEKEGPRRQEPKTDEETVKKHVELILKQRDRIKLKVFKGEMSKDDAKVALKKLDKALESINVSRTSPAPIDPPTVSKTLPLGSDELPAEHKAQSTDLHALRTKLEHVQKKIQKIQNAVKDGKIDKDTAKSEYSKLVAEEKDLRAQCERLSNSPQESVPVVTNQAQERSAPASSPSTKDQDLAVKKAEVEKQIDRVKRRVGDGSMDKEQAQRHLEKLIRMRKDLDAKLKAESVKKEPPSQSQAKVVSSSDDSLDTRSAHLPVQEEDNKVKEEMDKIKRYVYKGKMSKEDGKRALEKLQRQRVVQSRVGPDPHPPTKDLSATVEDAPDVPDIIFRAKSSSPGVASSSLSETNQERALEEIKNRIANIKMAIAKGKLDEVDGKKMLKRLVKEGQALSIKGGETVNNGEPESSRAPKPAPTQDSPRPQIPTTNQLDLNQVLDPEILEEILREEKTPRPVVKENSLKHVAADSQISTTPASPASPAPSLPGTFPLTDKRDPTSCNIESKTTSGSPGAMTKQPPGTMPDHPPSWSKALVSLTTCIDIANFLLSDLLDRHDQEAGEGRRSGTFTESLWVNVIPRVLTALVMQKDAEKVLATIFGDANQQSLESFVEHLGQVQRYLVHLERNKDGHEPNGNGATERDIFGPVDRLLELHTLISSDNFRSLLNSWRHDGLTVQNIIKTIQFIKHDLSTDAKYEDETRTGGILEKLVALLTIEQVDQGNGPEKRHVKRVSLRSEVESTPLSTSNRTLPVPSSSSRRKRLASMISSPRHPTGTCLAKPSSEHDPQLTMLDPKPKDEGKERGKEYENSPRPRGPRAAAPMSEPPSQRDTRPISTKSITPSPSDSTRQSLYSSDSDYSVSSEGTIESDREARMLLSSADSGPSLPGRDADDTPRPSPDQV